MARGVIAGCRDRTSSSNAVRAADVSKNKVAVGLLHALQQSKSRLEIVVAPDVIEPSENEDLFYIPKIMTAAERAEALKVQRAHAVAVSGGEGSGTSSNQDKGTARNQPDEASQTLKLKSRLNGKHDWKWKVSPKDKFLKVRATYVKIKLYDFV